MPRESLLCGHASSPPTLGVRPATYLHADHSFLRLATRAEQELRALRPPEEQSHAETTAFQLMTSGLCRCCIISKSNPRALTHCLPMSHA